MNNLLDFSGKVALITGAATGMGLATAQAFAKVGAAVVLADFKEDAVKTTAQKLAAAGHRTLAVRRDVSDDVQVAAMVDRTVAEFSRLRWVAAAPAPWAPLVFRMSPRPLKRVPLRRARFEMGLGGSYPHALEPLLAVAASDGVLCALHHVR